MDVIEIPTNMPVIRKDLQDAVYKTRKEKLNAIVEAVKEAHAKGHLESNRGQRLAFPLYFHMFLSLNRLMQAIGITPARHNTSCKLIHNQNLRMKPGRP